MGTRSAWNFFRNCHGSDSNRVNGSLSAPRRAEIRRRKAQPQRREACSRCMAETSLKEYSPIDKECKPPPCKLEAAVSKCIWHGHASLKVIHRYGSTGGGSRIKPHEGRPARCVTLLAGRQRSPLKKRLLLVSCVLKSSVSFRRKADFMVNISKTKNPDSYEVGIP